jgi:hypothetical protein
VSRPHGPLAADARGHIDLHWFVKRRHASPRLPKLQSAGLLLFRRWEGSVQVLLGHPGGPFWRSKDLGAWSIPKGLISPDEAPLSAARREFVEETVTDRKAALSSLELQDSLAARLFMSGLSRTTGTPPSLKATRSNWSGRRDRVVVRPFPKSIGRNGSASRSRGRRSSRARPSSSIGSQNSLAGQTTNDYALHGLSRSRTASLAARAPLGSRSWIKLRSRALPDKRAA